jgi:hypothetical protein
VCVVSRDFRLQRWRFSMLFFISWVRCLRIHLCVAEQNGVQDTYSRQLPLPFISSCAHRGIDFTCAPC